MYIYIYKIYNIYLYITPLQGPQSVLTCAFILKYWLFGLFSASAYSMIN